MSDVNVKVAQYKKPPAPPIMRCASDAEKSQAHVGSPPLPLKLSHFDSEKSASNEIIDVVRTLPRRLLPKKQITALNKATPSTSAAAINMVTWILAAISG